MRGGRNLFPLLPKAFAGIKTIGVIGCVLAMSRGGEKGNLLLVLCGALNQDQAYAGHG